MSIHLHIPDYIVVFVSDMERSVAFYRDTLGIPMKFTSPGWSEFNTGATRIALHRTFGSPASHASQSSQSSPKKEDLAVREGQSPVGQAQIGFIVDDLQAAYEELKAKDVFFSLSPQKQPAGRTFAVLHDPDGQAILLQQREQ